METPFKYVFFSLDSTGFLSVVIAKSVSQGFTGCPDHQKREEYVISKCWDRDDEAELVYYVEMACNDMFGAGKGGMIGRSS